MKANELKEFDRVKFLHDDSIMEGLISEIQLNNIFVICSLKGICIVPGNDVISKLEPLSQQYKEIPIERVLLDSPCQICKIEYSSIYGYGREAYISGTIKEGEFSLSLRKNVPFDLSGKYRLVLEKIS